MTDLDLDRLGDVWRQQPDPAEMERLQRTAAAVSRRARFARIVDIAGARSRPRRRRCSGLVSIRDVRDRRTGRRRASCLLLASNIRQRRLRRIELRSLTGSTEDMLDQSIERVEDKLKYERFCLFAVTPFLVVGYVAASALRPESGIVKQVLGASRDLWVPIFVILAGVAATTLYFALSMRRGRQELERLRALREACREERASTDT